MPARREFLWFAVAAAVVPLVLFGPALTGSRVLSPADVVFASRSFAGLRAEPFEPENRLLMDPVLQFQPWLEFNRAMLRQGRLPLWNRYAGCGAPHLANGQSAVFDPFHLIAYLGPWPAALGWMGALRLWFAAVGMFLLGRAWGLGPWGRWFAALTFPLCGFLSFWLLYPVTNSAVWLPWCFWATERTLNDTRSRNLGLFSITVAGTILGGHIQTAAHVLLAVGLYVVWRLVRWEGVGGIASARRSLVRWGAGTGLGLMVGAMGIVPLACYLARSPVWADRHEEHPGPLVITRPRVLDALCTGMPYLFGSQRRGQPNLARALGVHNLNESAGGYAGLATLLWLAPAGWLARKADPRLGFLGMLWVVGAMGAFGVPPVINLLRGLPVLDVMDQRRLTLWVAFASALLGGAGLDALGQRATIAAGAITRWWASLWAVAGLMLVLGALGVKEMKPWLDDRARSHYRLAAEREDATSLDTYQRRAESQVGATLRFIPWSWGLSGVELLGLSALAGLMRRGRIGAAGTRPALLALTLLEMTCVARGANPLTSPADQRPETPLVKRLRVVAGGGRMLGLGAEWPPNLAMRYGLADVRNYDSIELRRAIAWLGPLYEPDRRPPTSRGTITWAGVERAGERLAECGVRAIVSADEPPAAWRASGEPIGGVWLTRVDGRPLASLASGGAAGSLADESGRINGIINCFYDDLLIIRQTFDPGWTARVDGRDVAIQTHRDIFMAVPIPAGEHRVELRYDPPEVRVAAGLSSVGLALTLLALIDAGPRRWGRFRSQGLGPFRAPRVESSR